MGKRVRGWQMAIALLLGLVGLWEASVAQGRPEIIWRSGGHRGGVAVAFSPLLSDGRYYLASGSWDGTIKLWRNDGTCVGTLLFGVETLSRFGNFQVARQAGINLLGFPRSFSSVQSCSPDYSKDPVVMVHGYGGNSFLWFWMMRNLIREGWPPEYLFAIDFSNNVGCNERNAEELKAFIEEVLRRTGKEKVDIIAHSMGGLSARYYIKFLGGHTKVNDYVSLGTPHQGTPAAVFVSLTCGGRQMVPGSDFLRRLNSGDATPSPVKYTSIWSTGDALVPCWSAYIPGARLEVVFGITHAMYLIDEIQVLPIVIEALNGGGRN